jgi:chemotaxis protein CheY-P-specific phosphatase CheC
MQEVQPLTKNEISTWTRLIGTGVSNAFSGLSSMTGIDIKVDSLEIKQVPAKNAASALGALQGMVIGSWQQIRGDTSGCVILIHEPHIAFDLIDLQTGRERGSTRQLEETERSTLEEISNITSAFFLNTIADSTGLTLIPSPPVVMFDTIEGILENSLTEMVKKQKDIYIIKISFSNVSQQIRGIFLVIPTLDFLKVLGKAPSTGQWQPVPDFSGIK